LPQKPTGFQFLSFLDFINTSPFTKKIQHLGLSPRTCGPSSSLGTLSRRQDTESCASAPVCVRMCVSVRNPSFSHVLPKQPSS
jgi:hypothetical protein